QGPRRAQRFDGFAGLGSCLRRSTRGIKIHTCLIRAADLEQQRLFEHQRAIAGDGLGLRLLVRGRGGAPARRIDSHRTTSRRAASKESMSSSVTVSVTAITRPFPSAATPGYKRPSDTPPSMPFSTIACTAGRASTGSLSVN